MYNDAELNLLQKKARERTVKTQSIEYDLETLVKKIKRGYIKLDPDYQRRHRWHDGTSSRLIESLILNIPIPMVYLSLDVDIDEEVDEGIPRYTVIDGQQRLTAIMKFFTDDLVLKELDVLSDLEGKRYSELPKFLIRRLEERAISCLRIDSTVDEQVKYDIFERLNSGSVELTAQELRNAVIRSPFNEMIKKLAENDDFRRLIQISPTSKSKVEKMEDVELVLRFFSLIEERYQDYKGGFKQYLTNSMKVYSKYNSEELEKYANYFNKTMKVIRKVFGDEAFAKYRINSDGSKRMSKYNVSVFDALIIGVDSVEKLNSINTKHAKNFRELFRDEEFFDSITGSVNDARKLFTRASKSKEVFKN